MNDARAVGYLELNISGFQEALTTAKRALTVFAVSFTAFKGIKFLADATNDAIKFGDALYHASQAAGRFNPESFFLISKALQNAGLSASEAQSKITEFVGNGRRIQDLFGGSAQYGAALKNAAKEYGAEAKVFGENAAKFAKVFETLQAVGEKTRTFFAQVAAQFLKPLQALLDSFQRMDFAGTAQKFGEKIADALNLLNGFVANGGFGEALGLAVKIGFKKATNFLIEAVMVALQTFGAGIDLIFSNMRFLDGFSESLVAIAGVFGVALLKAVSGVLAFFQGQMDYAFASQQGKGGTNLKGALVGAGLGYLAGNVPGAIFGAGLGLVGRMGKNLAQLDPEDRGKKDVWDYINERQKKGVEFGFGGKPFTLDDAMKQQQADLAAAIKKTAGAAPTLGKELLEAFKNALAEAKKNGGVFDTSEDEAKLNAILTRALAAGQEQADKAKSKLPDVLAGSTGAVSPYAVIADSLARIGGGGGFLRTGQNIAAQAQMQNTRATEENTRATNALERAIQRVKGNLSPTNSQRGAAHFNDVLSSTLMLS